MFLPLREVFLVIPSWLLEASIPLTLRFSSCIAVLGSFRYAVPFKIKTSLLCKITSLVSRYQLAVPMTHHQTYLYIQGRSDLQNWDFQSPPKGSVPSVGEIVGRGLPKFGLYEQQRKKLKAEKALKAELLPEVAPFPVPSTAKPSTVKQQIGRAVSRIGNYNDLDNKVSIIVQL